MVEFLQWLSWGLWTATATDLLGTSERVVWWGFGGAVLIWLVSLIA